MYCTEENADENQVLASTNSKATVQASAAREKVVKITIELKQLELLAAEVEESASRLSATAGDAVTADDVVQNNLDAAQRDAQVKARPFGDLTVWEHQNAFVGQAPRGPAGPATTLQQTIILHSDF